MACCSVIGQCLFYVHGREMILRLFPEQRRAPQDIGALAGHIFRFSQAGLAAMRRETTAGAAQPRSRPPQKSKTQKTYE
jgi:hypothetical protein